MVLQIMINCARNGQHGYKIPLHQKTATACEIKTESQIKLENQIARNKHQKIATIHMEKSEYQGENAKHEERKYG